MIKIKSKIKRAAGVLAAGVLLATVAQAQLTATVSPGYQFAPGEVPTSSTLNLLGEPSIQIQGTVSGTVGLAAKSVSGDHLMDSVVDGITLDFNSASPRSIEVKAGGISSNQVALGGIQGTNLANNTVTTTNLAVNAVMPTNIFYGPITLSGATPTVDWSTAHVFLETLTANTTFSFANVISGQIITLVLIQGGSGSYTATWPAGIKWRGGVAPTLSTTVGQADIISILRASGNYYGNVSVGFY